MRVLKYLLLIVGIFVVLGIILYWFHPYAPFFLVASILIQAPIIYCILKSSYCNSYEERIHKRREKYEEEGEWEEWLEREEREAGSVGFRLLPPRARGENVLLRIELLWKLKRFAEAENLLDDLDAETLSDVGKERLDFLKTELEQETAQKPFASHEDG